MRRVLIAAIAVLVLDIAITFGAALAGSRGVHNLLYWTFPPVAVALVAFPTWRGRLLAVAGLWPLFVPGAILSELLAHLFGHCLQ